LIDQARSLPAGGGGLVSRCITARVVPSRTTPDLLAGIWSLLAEQLGAVSRRLVWDNEAGIGRGGHLGAASSAAWAAAGAAARRLHDAPLPPWPGQTVDEIASRLDGEWQAHGAEMLKIACCLATERSTQVGAAIHDVLLIEAPITLIDDAVSTTRGAMAEAAAKVLDSVVWIDTDVEIVRYPDRYSDPRGQLMWDRVISMLPTTPATVPVTLQSDLPA
jgi:hypothetical protein